MRNILKVNRVFLLLLVFTILFIFSVAFALEVNWPKSPLGTDLVASCSTIQATSSCNFATLTKYFYEWGIALGGLATFVALVIAGFQYLTSMGEPARLAEARGKIRSAIFGLILLLGSWIILNTINPQLLSFSPLSYNVGSLLISSQCTTTDHCINDCKTYINPTECEKYNFNCVSNFCHATPKPCYKIIVYSNISFTGNETTIERGIKSKQEVSNARSLKAFLKSTTGSDIECGPSGCGCFVNLYAGGFLGWGCGDLIGSSVAYLPDIYSIADRPVKCIELVTPPGM
jgi:hypothetical protein